MSNQDDLYVEQVEGGSFEVKMIIMCASKVLYLYPLISL